MAGVGLNKKNFTELQKFDCNCNDCKHMVRDFDTYRKWEQLSKELQLKEFERKKTEAFRIANECKDENGKKTLLSIASKMKFMFDKSGLLQYGKCQKFNKQVSFIPSTCQLETQKCFEHRRM